VIFLLAFAFIDLTFIDLAFPQFCGDDRVALVASSENEDSRQNDGACAAADVRDSQRNRDSQPVSADEDCFCCCSHIMPGRRIAVAPPEMTPRLNILSTELLPSPPPRDTFHPPRLA